MLEKKFTELLNSSEKFNEDFKNRFLESFKSSTTAQKIQLIADLDLLLKSA